ncbi:MAG: alcohol dehydrogenase catalytic domain-containing protein [Lachnospiraceae bacterium]|nr:alcohol dehydrogenase catalytic domain-containing protein [Lachnospiraceae bacterium]MDD4525852.1 alcohol dehydrogenase catalytic domain-containing protein [Lachnospiraceae bacterium]
MKAVRIEAPGIIHMVEAPIPEPEEGFARVKVEACAVCATDLEIIDGRIPANYPLIPGHEWSGIVDAVGSDEDASWIGKAVIGSNDVVCLKCDACRSGNWRYCKNFEEIGFKRNGAYAEYVIVPCYGLAEKPDDIPFEEAALCEPLGVALGAMQKADAKFGNTMMIMGSGSIGLCMLAVGKAMGMRRITVCARSEGRLGIAKQMGAYATIATENKDLEAEIAKIHPDGTDVIVDATGIESCIQSCLRICTKGGTVVLAGYGRGKMMNIRMDDIHIKNLRVIGAGNNWNMHKKAISLMEDGLIDLNPMISRRLPLEDFESAIEMARKRPEGFVKAVFVRVEH